MNPNFIHIFYKTLLSFLCIKKQKQWEIGFVPFIKNDFGRKGKGLLLALMFGTTAIAAPTITNDPFTDTTIECDEAVNGLPFEAPIFFDPNDPDLLIIIDSTDMPDPCGYHRVRSWTAIADDGTSAMFVQTVSVLDSEAPELTITNPMMAGVEHGDVLYLECDEIMALTVNDATAIDNCCLDDITFQESVVAGNCLADGYIQIMTCGYIATDCCGNVDSLFFQVYVIDETAPTLIGVPEDEIIGCGNLPGAPANVTPFDNCNNVSDLYVVHSADTVGLTIIRYWSVTDWCGNSMLDSQIIYLSNPDDITFENFPPDVTTGCNDPIPPVVTVTATSTCGNVAVSMSEEENTDDPCVRVIERIYTATHENGSVAVDTQFINIVDDVAPEIELVHPDLIGLMYGDSLEYECTDVPVFGIDDILATDACSDVDNIMLIEEIAGQYECSTNGFYLLMRCGWKVTDVCGNMTDFIFYIKVTDDTRPVIVSGAPADITVSCDNIPAPSANIVASDNCDPDPTVGSFDSTIGSGCSYIIERTWTVTDDCGNVTEYVQTITVEDDEDPSFTSVPPNTTANCDDLPAPTMPTATDNCSGVSITMSDSTGTGCPYNIYRTWTATDDCGNSIEHIQLIEVVDNEMPTGVEPTGFTLECDDIVPTPIQPNFTDNCDANLSVVFSQSSQTINCGQELTWTWTATDACGNVGSVDQIVTILDTEAPVISWVNPLLNGLSDGDTLRMECNNITVFDASDATAADNCGNANVTFQESMLTLGDCMTDGYISSIACTWTATDDCGNESDITIYMQVVDSNPPVGVNPADITVPCGQSVPTPVEPAFTDSCDDDVTVVFGETSQTVSCGEELTWTWTATDDCGNSSSVDQIVTVLGGSDPIINLTNPALAGLMDGDTLTMDCDAQLIFGVNDAEVAAGCTNATLDFEEFGLMLGTCQTDGYIAFVGCRWIAMDDCGNESTLTIYMRVTDSTPPVGVEPSDITVPCGQSVPTPIEPAFTDSCDDDVTVVFGETSQTVSCGEELTWTWTATDDCGNSSSVDQIVTVLGGSDPIINLTNPALTGLMDGDTLTMDCDAQLIFGVNDAEVAAGCTNATLDFEEFGLMLGTCQTDGYIAFVGCRWIAMDDCGNESTLTIYMRVTDSTPPVGVEPSDITVPCGQSVPTPVEPAFTDSCDDDVTVVFGETSQTVSCGEELTWTWTATDDCGNSSSVDQIVTVLGGSDPIINLTNPALAGLMDGDTLTMDCDAQLIFGVNDAEVAAGCTIATLDFEEFGLMLGDCETDGYTAFVGCRWTAMDDCGNESTLTIYMRVEDNDPPVFTAFPSDVTVSCGDPIPPCSTPTVNDVCGNVTLSSLTIDVPTLDGFVRNCTWIATDDCGNSAEETQSIYVLNAPQLIAINTTPSVCGGNDGTAVVDLLQDEADYTWTWSPDLGFANPSGNTRIDIPAGTYMVTAADQNCSITYEVIVGDDCGCQAPVLENLSTTSAGCGTSNGTAIIELVGDESDYTYLWIPNLGVSGALDNSRTNLPAQHYTVVVYYQGDVNCTDKYEFDINDDCFDCPPVFEANALVVNVQEGNQEICVPVMHGISVSQDVQINQEFYNNAIESCETQQVKGYEYKNLTNNTLSGPLSVEWERGGVTSYTLVENMEELAAAMFQMDANGDWKNDPKGRCLVTTNVTGNYGQIHITNVPTEETFMFDLEDLDVAMETELVLEEGINEIIYTSSLSGCDDTMSVLMNIIPEVEIVTGSSETTTPVREGGNLTVLQDDVIKTSINEMISIDLLANDQIDGEVLNMKISSDPQHGQAFVLDKTMVTYLPRKDFCQPIGQADELVYEITTTDGRTFSATAQIEVACRSEHVLYPNPADRFFYLDVSSLDANTSLEVLIVNQLGVQVDRISMEQAPDGPFKIDLESYRSGYYTVWICPKNTKPLLKKLVITRL